MLTHACMYAYIYTTYGHTGDCGAVGAVCGGGGEEQRWGGGLTGHPGGLGAE